ncbi:serine protease [Actinokineospora soli]
MEMHEMRRDRTTRLGTAALGALAVLAVASPATAQTAAVRPAANPVPGSYIVVLKDAGASAQSTRSAASDLARQHGGTLTQTYTASLRGFAVKLGDAAAKRLAAHPAVAYVEQDGYATGSDTQPDATWGIDRIDQRDLPLNSSYTYPNTGSGATAYILDTGVDESHPDFEGRVQHGYDFIDNDPDASDCHGHGTHVAGTVGSKTYGVAKKVKLVSVRVLNCQSSGQWSQIIAGIDWVAKNAVKPAVANMSLGGGANTSVDNAVASLVSSGVTAAVASGNGNTDACGTSPARVSSAITVNATDRSDNRSSFSNYGSCTDIFAPGTTITSTRNGGGTQDMSGTSMATPHVAGTVALYLTTTPSATPSQVAGAVTGGATSGKVVNPGASSPNKLLYTGFIGGSEPPPSCAGGSNGTDVAIPDAGSAVTSDIALSNCSGSATASTAVKVDINHTYTADLTVELVGPSGRAYPLHRAGGVGSAAGIHATYTVDASSETKNGTWKLRVTDVYTHDTGVVDAWTLTF